MTGEPDDGGGPCVDDPEGGCVSPGEDCVYCSPDGTTPAALVLTISGIQGCSAIHTIGNSTWRVPQVSHCVWALDFELPLGPDTTCNLIDPAIGSIYIARTGFGTFSGSITWSIGVVGGLYGYLVEITFEAAWSGQCDELTFTGPIGSYAVSTPEPEDLCEECHDEFRPGGAGDGSAATFTLAAVDYNECPADSDAIDDPDCYNDANPCNCTREDPSPTEVAVTISGVTGDGMCSLINGTYILGITVSKCHWGLGDFTVPFGYIGLRLALHDDGEFGLNIGTPDSEVFFRSPTSGDCNGFFGSESDPVIFDQGDCDWSNATVMVSAL